MKLKKTYLSSLKWHDSISVCTNNDYNDALMRWHFFYFTACRIGGLWNKCSFVCIFKQQIHFSKSDRNRDQLGLKKCQTLSVKMPFWLDTCNVVEYFKTLWFLISFVFFLSLIPFKEFPQFLPQKWLLKFSTQRFLFDSLNLL